MTREIRVNENNNKSIKVCTHNVRNTRGTNRAAAGSGFFGFASGIAAAYTKAVLVKREIFARAVAVSEELADRTAREGLFGEDKGKGYAGTDVDYIRE